jgi:hypothetical protein
VKITVDASRLREDSAFWVKKWPEGGAGSEERTATKKQQIQQKKRHLIGAKYELKRIAGTTTAATQFATNGSARIIQKVVQVCTHFKLPWMRAERSVTRSSAKTQITKSPHCPGTPYFISHQTATITISYT